MQGTILLIRMRLAPESDSGVVIQPVMQRDSERWECEEGTKLICHQKAEHWDHSQSSQTTAQAPAPAWLNF